MAVVAKHNKVTLTFVSIACFILFFCLSLQASAARKYPSRPITNTVVWGAGGGTDVINRMLMAEMAKDLKVRITVANKTGGVAGSIGMSHVLSKKPDGYNLVGISESNVTAAVNGGWQNKFDVWSPFIVGGSPDVISVAIRSPYRKLEDLISEARKEGRRLKASASGSGSIHHLNLIALNKGAVTKITFIPYPGSAPSQTAVVTGEVDLVITSVAEQAALIKGGKLRPLAVLVPESFDISGYGIIPSAFTDYPGLSEYLPISQAIGFAIRNDASEEVKKTLAQSFERALNSSKVKSWAEQNFYSLSGKSGEEARKVFENLESTFAWTLYELGAAKSSPVKFGIVKP